MIRVLFVVFSCLLLCGNVYGQVTREAKKTADALTGDDKKSAAENPQCKLYTLAEVKKYMGEPVTAGQNAALGTGCQWIAKSENGDMMVQVVPASYHVPPTLGKGYRTLPDVGTQGFILPELGGWAAGAIKGDESIHVSMAGPGSKAEIVIDLLKETLKRWTKQLPKH